MNYNLKLKIQNLKLILIHNQPKTILNTEFL